MKVIRQIAWKCEPAKVGVAGHGHTRGQQWQRGLGLNRRGKAIAWQVVTIIMAGAVTLLAGCSATTIKHGHHLRPSDIQQIQPGMGEDQVRLALGTPATTSRTVNGKTYYYISSTMEQRAFFQPTEVDRKVLAVFMSPVGTVQRVANYGLKDGKVFDFIARKTPSAGSSNFSILNSLFRNIGKRGIADAG